MLSAVLQKQAPFVSLTDQLHEKLSRREARIAVIGLGYVGFPLTVAFHRKGFSLIGFDTDPQKIETIHIGGPYITMKGQPVVQELVESKRFQGTTNPLLLHQADIIIICVPTPLTKHWEPDMSYVESTAQTIAAHLKPGQLVVLESTTYPGTTTELVKTVLETSGLRCGEDFFLAYSPEREDPGNVTYGTTDIPKVVGADDPASGELVEALYRHIVPQVVPVSSMACAEAVKITENIFRCVNIALVNELKIIYQKMGIDIWEVIKAAETKPFGFMPFYPGPGLGGHCIPIDPFYLSWKARAYGLTTRFIELAGEINHAMPDYVIQRLREGLDHILGRGIRGSKILLLGLAYKKNVSDMRESPALAIFKKLKEAGGNVDYYDPHILTIPSSREYPFLEGVQSIVWDQKVLKSYEAALICTDHDHVDYKMLVDSVPLVIDTRHATASLPEQSHIWKA